MCGLGCATRTDTIAVGSGCTEVYPGSKRESLSGDRESRYVSSRRFPPGPASWITEREHGSLILIDWGTDTLI